MPQTATHHQCTQSPTPTTMRFCPRVAAALGVSEAIVLHRLDYWLSRSKHRIEGRAWVYNTYDAWQAQFPFWSRRTIQATFRRLERLGVVESTQRHNRSRWDKMKWYTINYAKLGELAPQPPAEDSADEGQEPPPSMEPEGLVDEAETAAIEDAEDSPLWITKNSSMDYSNKIPKRGCASEPEQGAPAHPLEAAKPVVTECHHEDADDLDAAYEAIPEGERATWYEHADKMLASAGMPEWMRITPTVKEMAVRLWVGDTTPVLASG